MSFAWQWSDSVIDKEKESHRVILHEYFLTLEALRKTATGQLSPKEKMMEISEENVRQASLAFGIMRNAHIFEFGPQTYIDLYHGADVYVEESVLGSAWTPAGVFNPDETPEEFKDRTDNYVTKVVAAGERIQLPDNKPFDSMYIAWGGSAPMSPINKMIYRMRHPKAGIDNSAKSLALVISPTHVFEILSMDLEPWHPSFPDVSRGILQINHYENGRWLLPESLMPWMVASIIGAINQNESLITAGERSLWDRERARKTARTLRIHAVPPPYYRVYIKSAHIKEALSTRHIPAKIERSHRFDVRGHYASRIIRGSLPMAEKIRKKLLKRKYKIHSAMNPVDVESMSVLMRHRQAPPALGEWVAIRRWWQSDHLKGPKDAPYIPSTRKLKRKTA
jgi:hypothetical protein